MAVGNYDIDAGQVLRQVYTPSGTVGVGSLNVLIVGTASSQGDFLMDQWQILDSVYDEATNSLRVVTV